MADSEETKWIEDCWYIICPFCNTRFNDDISNYNMTNGSIPKYCPECGKNMMKELNMEKGDLID